MSEQSKNALEPGRASLGGMKLDYAVCRSCDKTVGYTECLERGEPTETARCNVLTGWLSVSHWRGMEATDYHDFCSFTCLQKWVDSKIPKIPETFLKAFEGQ